MEARAWASDRSSALKAFARYEARLAEELGAKPGADLVRMADLLRDGRRAPRPAVAGYPPPRIDRRFEPETLIGREREFSVLYDAWLEARRKNPRVVVVKGDPGVGKTTLVNAFASTCQMDGAVVGRAQAYDAERDLPFAVLGELARQLASQRAIGSADPEALSELTRISPEILKAFPGVPKPEVWTPELTPLRIADAFLKTITSAAADSPLLMVVDDIHAADNASSAILHSVARKMIGTRVLLVLIGRSNEMRLSPAPWHLMSDGGLRDIITIDLETLSSEASEKLISRLVNLLQSSDPPIARILQASGGNPLAIELLTKEWASHGAASLLRDLEALDKQPAPMIGIPPAIDAVFQKQSRRLIPPVRAALGLAAVLGRRLTEFELYEAIKMSPEKAAEALSCLRDEGFLREVRGDLEFRNELIRAEAYYSVTGTTRQHLHRRVAEILANRLPGDDKTVSLEIAWHHLKGGDVLRAVPYAVEGAEAVLSVGAPHAAEEILRAIIDVEHGHCHAKAVRLLLARALVDQSKAEPALPIIERLMSDQGLTPQERAEVMLLRTSAEFLRGRYHANNYGDFATVTLTTARDAGDVGLIARALFECARAGSEEGITELIHAAERGIEKLGATTNIATLPMATVTKAFCRFYLDDPRGALGYLQIVANTASPKANAAHLAFVHSGIGMANLFLCDFEAACNAFMTALEFARKVGDDTRVSQIATNLCTSLMTRGSYEESIRYGEMSVRLGEVSSSSSLLTCYTNLIDPYILTGREEAAVECLEKAKRWLSSGRRWKLRCAFLVEAANFALIQRNHALALDLIGQLDQVTTGRENAVPMPGPFWKLKVFRMYHQGYHEDADRIIVKLSERWRTNCPFQYLDMLAARAWTERQNTGQISNMTQEDLKVFEDWGAKGRKALFTIHGFLQPSTDEYRKSEIIKSNHYDNLKTSLRTSLGDSG